MVMALVVSIAIVGETGCVREIGTPVNGNIRSILVMPVINETDNEQVPLVFNSVLQYALAERGYYVLAPHAISHILSENHIAPNSTEFFNVKEMVKLFDVDAVLYVTVESYEVKTIVVSTKRHVGLRYKIYDRYANLIHEDMHYAQYPLHKSSFNPIATIAKSMTVAAGQDSPENAMEAVSEIIFDFVPGPYHKKDFGIDVSVPFQDKIILEKHPRELKHTRIVPNRDKDNI